eukprot:SAG31_NODE_1683_length_7534_cov_16.225824_5_plen_216_part_01
MRMPYGHAGAMHMERKRVQATVHPADQLAAGSRRCHAAPGSGAIWAQMGCAQSNVCAGREAKKKDEDDGDGDGDESEEDLLGDNAWAKTSEADFSNGLDDMFGDILAMTAQFEADTPPPERRAPPPPAVPRDPALTAAASLFGAPPRVQMSESECSDREESFVTDSAGSGGADDYDMTMKKICGFDLTRDPRTDVIVATSLLTRDEGGALPLHLAA